MCHHYRTRAAIKANLKPEWDNEFSLRSNLYQLTPPEVGFYPLEQAPVVRLDKDGQREMVAAEWGFLPGWWKPSDRTPKRQAFQRKTINARSEEVAEKPTYRESFRRRRCLMPAEEFFERGYYFHLEDRRPFAFAALWDSWRDGDGSVLETCTLLTTESNEAVAAVGHPRMPVILTNEWEYYQWLDPELAGRGAIERLLRPTPASLWRTHQAAPPSQPAARQAASERGANDRDKEMGQGFLF